MRSLPPLIAALAVLHAAPGRAQVVDVQAGAVPQGSVVADFNGDRLLDIAVANAFDGTVSILLHQPGLSFAGTVLNVGAPATHPFNFPRFLATAELNGDGSPDLLVLCSGSNAFSVQPAVQALINRGDGTFVAGAVSPLSVAPLVDPFPVHFVTGFFDADSHTDVAIAANRGDAVRILSGQGGGRFLPAVELAADAPEYLVTRDWDQDGRDDLFVVTTDGLLLFRQPTVGAFAAAESIATGAGPLGLRSLSILDFANDGLTDLIAADADGSLRRISGVDALGQGGTTSVINSAEFVTPTDTVRIQWDDDLLPDLAVASQDGSRVTILLSSGGEVSLPCAAEPRRLLVADFNDDGAEDLLVLHQGDRFDSSNVDLRIHLNVPAGTEPTPDATVALNDRVGVRLPQTVGIASTSNGRVWLLEASRLAIQELNPSPALNANPQARVLRRRTFPFVVGGVDFTTQNAGFVIERDSGRIHGFNPANANLNLLTTVAAAPGSLGFLGLACDATTGDYFVAAPSLETIFRISPSGAVAGTFNVGQLVGDLSWNPDADRLSYTMGGSPIVRAISGAGVPLAAGTLDALAGYRAFRGRTAVGVALSADEAVYTLIESGSLVVLSAADSVVSVIATAPASGTLHVAIDGAEENVYLLGSDLHAARLNLPDWNAGELVSLWPALAADPEFVPSGIAAASEVLYVADAHRPLAARFTAAAGYLGATSYPAPFGHGSPTGALALRAGAPVFLLEFAAWSPTEGVLFPASPVTAGASFSIEGDLALFSTSNPRQLAIRNLVSGEQWAGPLTSATPQSGYTLLPGGSQLLHAEPSPTNALLATFDVPEASSRVHDWMAAGGELSPRP